MKSPSLFTKLPTLALLAAGMLLFPSCKTSGEQWSFSVSRSVYGGKGASAVYWNPRVHCNGDSNAAAAGLVVLLLLPVIIDVIILPVTLTHDLCDR